MLILLTKLYKINLSVKPRCALSLGRPQPGLGWGEVIRQVHGFWAISVYPLLPCPSPIYTVFFFWLSVQLLQANRHVETTSYQRHRCSHGLRRAHGEMSCQTKPHRLCDTRNQAFFAILQTSTLNTELICGHYTKTCSRMYLWTSLSSKSSPKLVVWMLSSTIAVTWSTGPWRALRPNN